MKVAFRTDSSLQIGSGHLMRCLTLADALRGRGAEVSFVSRELPGNICDFVENKGYRLFRLPFSEGPSTVKPDDLYARWLGVDWQADAGQTRAILQKKQLVDWLIVDHYALNSRWELEMRPFVRKIMAIDDLAERPHDCDLLLDQNLYENMESRYDGLVPSRCRKLLGPKYALLRPEFIEARKNLRERDGKVRRILVFFGGSDPSNETTKALEALRLLNRPDIAVDVIAGASNPYKDQLRQLCADMDNVAFHCNISNMAQMMALADLAIGAGGSTTWERCCLGLPSIVISIAANQDAIANECNKVGACKCLQDSKNVTSNEIATEIENFILNPASLIAYGKKAASFVDGEGVLRVASIILSSNGITE